MLCFRQGSCSVSGGARDSRRSRVAGILLRFRRGSCSVSGGARDSGRSGVAEILLCFSFLRSVRRVIAEGNTDHLFSLSGVRVLSISWIVLGNTISLLHKNPAVLGECYIVGHSVPHRLPAAQNPSRLSECYIVGHSVPHHLPAAQNPRLLR